MQVERIPALTINCPEFFARADFQAWLNATNASLGGGQRATWHTLGSAPTEFSDTFITYDGPRASRDADISDGSDFDELFPADIKLAITEACIAQGFDEGIIRLTNLAE